jgi:glycine/D-amino acid oxidase-like deaminating enzyme/nitrite reductase/ring-hydroxylating ferredoxin subunit
VTEPGLRSVWHRRPPGTRHFPALSQDLGVDCAVVGAGITGLTTAALLASEGRSVAVLERNQVASGTTGSSSAHLTYALDTDYRTLVTRFGDDAVRGVVDSLRAALETIAQLAAADGRECGFRRVPGFRFAEEAAQAESLVAEAECARRLGIAVAQVEHLPLPLPCAAVIRFEDQAEIDPVAYCELLASLVVARGGRIFEDTAVTEAADGYVVTADGFRVDAEQVIEATHTPLGLAPALQTRLGAFTSYCVAARLSERIEPGLYWDCEDPYHYLRALDDGYGVLAGGKDHRTGREDFPARRLRSLKEWLRARLPVESFEACWSHEFFEPADGLPYIGLLPGARSHYVATGFSGTGLTFGTVAARLLRDLVLQGTSPWQEIYTPARWKPLASGRNLAKENLGVAWHLLASRLRSGEDGSLVELRPEKGCITRIDGQNVAAYRDAEGELHVMSPRCTHLGCHVAWNDLDKTWDCPCHGGRFRATGEPFYGPPVERLARAERMSKRQAETTVSLADAQGAPRSASALEE